RQCASGGRCSTTRSATTRTTSQVTSLPPGTGSRRKTPSTSPRGYWTSSPTTTKPRARKTQWRQRETPNARAAFRPERWMPWSLRRDLVADADLAVVEHIRAEAPLVDEGAERAGPPCRGGQALQVRARLAQPLGEALDVADPEALAD